MKITKCIGEGQGSCKMCTDNGKWNRSWMCFLYKIEGLDGCYCKDCVKEIVDKKSSEQKLTVREVNMRKFKGTISTNVAGSKCEFDFEVEDGATEEEIETEARDSAFNWIEWDYHEIS